MRITTINYLTKFIDSRGDKPTDDLYFCKALNRVIEWIAGTANLKIKPKNIFERAFSKLTSAPYEEDPFEAVFS